MPFVRYMAKLPKTVIAFKFHPLHAKTSTPIGPAVPVGKSKEFPSVIGSQSSITQCEGDVTLLL